jgi:hypothetical protein
MNQIGGGNCSLCKSPNTTKTTCPLNPDAKKPNVKKHPLAQQNKNKKFEDIPFFLLQPHLSGTQLSKMKRVSKSIKTDIQSSTTAQDKIKKAKFDNRYILIRLYHPLSESTDQTYITQYKNLKELIEFSDQVKQVNNPTREQAKQYNREFQTIFKNMSKIDLNSKLKKLPVTLNGVMVIELHKNHLNQYIFYNHFPILPHVIENEMLINENNLQDAKLIVFSESNPSSKLFIKTKSNLVFEIDFYIDQDIYPDVDKDYLQLNEIKLTDVYSEYETYDILKNEIYDDDDDELTIDRYIDNVIDWIRLTA